MYDSFCHKIIHEQTKTIAKHIKKAMMLFCYTLLNVDDTISHVILHSPDIIIFVMAKNTKK